MKKLWPYPKYAIKPVMHNFIDGGLCEGWLVMKKKFPFLPWTRYSDLQGDVNVFKNKQECLDIAIHLMYGGVDVGEVRDGELITLWLRGMMK